MRVLKIKVTKVECRVVDDSNGAGGVGAPTTALGTTSGISGGPEFELEVPGDADRNLIKNMVARTLMGGVRVVVPPGAGRFVPE